MKMPEDVDAVTRLGYPVHLLSILVVWKILGVVAVLIPKFPRLTNVLQEKERLQESREEENAVVFSIYQPSLSRTGRKSN